MTFPKLPDPRNHPHTIAFFLLAGLFFYGKHLAAQEEDQYPARKKTDVVVQLARKVRATELAYIKKQEETDFIVALGMANRKDSGVRRIRVDARTQIVELAQSVSDMFNISPATLLSVGVTVSRDDFGGRFICNDSAIKIRTLIKMADRIGWTKKAKLWSPVLAFAYEGAYDECPGHSPRDMRARIEKLEEAHELYLRDGWTSRAIHRRIDKKIEAIMKEADIGG